MTGASVYEKDGRRIREAIDAMRRGATSTAGIYDWSRSLVPLDMRAREAYSYGRHFPLFRYVPRSGRNPEVFVINGDDSPRSGRGWGGSRTPDHQSDTRAYVEKLGAASVVIPFSALAGAGIDIDSVRPVHVRPDARWTETLYGETLQDVPLHARRIYDSARGEYRDRAPDADGRYSWTVHRHRLGDCLFSAVRESSRMRPARPFEVDSDTGRVRIEVAWRDSYCNVSGARHEAGPSGACVHCTRPLQVRETVRRRARYLSSFDYQERAPLYFLAQVPRGAGETVDAAIESLAPRAVHAARARGLEVARQGDIFFIATPLTDTDLAARGIVGRARLTQWDRGARARRGETGYRPPLTAAGRRAMLEDMREDWRRIFRQAVQTLTYRDAARAGPKSAAGARKDWKKQRAEHARRLDAARAELRRAILGGKAPRFYGRADRYGAANRYGPAAIVRERAGIAESVRRARETVARLEQDGRAIACGRAAARDAYRAPFSNGGPQNAAVRAWSMARAGAMARHIPHEYDGAAIESRRAAVRTVLAIYGTAHTAREVIRTRSGAVYTRGRVSHRPDLDTGRRDSGGPDHAPLDLDPTVWFLAVRNTVPRARA